MPIWLLMVMAVIVLALIGLGVKFYCDKTVGPQHVTWIEYVVSMIVIAIVICPLVGWAGMSLALKSNLTFTEFHNGWEGFARVEEIMCHEDGSCRWDYNCHPYIVMVPYPCGTSKNPSTCMRPETRYHQCPYVTSEYSYYVDTTLGSYTIDSHRLPLRPNSHRWSSFESVPGYVIASAGTGEPAFWTAARERIARKNPWPVTKSYDYDNFILASRYTILRQYRGAADEYLSQGLLPVITNTIRNDSFYRSDKVHLVGCSRTQYEAWNEQLERLNAAFGSELRGDVQLVLTCNPVINRNPDRYKFALEAYWQDIDAFKRHALPKNVTVVILGTTDQKTVAWGRAFTGMPIGNENMTVAISNRFMVSRAVAWDPNAVIGMVTGIVTQNGSNFQSTSVRTGGVLTDVLWGVSNPASRFQRVSMTAKEKGDIGTGFEYLASEVILSGLQKFLILLAVVLVSAIAFSVIAFNDFFASFNRKYERS